MLLLLRLFQGPTKNPYNLALVHWFNIHSKTVKVYNCPQLYYTKEYNTIPIEYIEQEVHIVLRFEKKIGLKVVQITSKLNLYFEKTWFPEIESIVIIS